MSTKEPKLTIEYLPVDSIKRYGRNTKKHTKTQVSQIRKSISEFSFNDPVAVWGPDNELVEADITLPKLQPGKWATARIWAA